jgi:hypothetical protein
MSGTEPNTAAATVTITVAEGVVPNMVKAACIDVVPCDREVV